MERVPPFDGQQLESISRLLADTDKGLTGPQIAHLLQECGMSDPTSSMTKWKRLYNAFVEAQKEHQVGNHVVMFIARVMKPVRYTTDPQGFAQRRDQLNVILSFPGLFVGDDGRVRWANRATNLDQAL